MRLPRACGILLHPTSLPGPHGIGDLGPAAFRFVDWLAEARQRLWQVLPLGPTGYGDSPYQSFSAFAGNPLLISLEQLAAEGLLDPADLPPPSDPGRRVDYGVVSAQQRAVLQRAYDRFRSRRDPSLSDEFSAFRERERDWLPDYALFMALRQAFGDVSWHAWPAELRRRAPASLPVARQTYAESIGLEEFMQWQFFRQWERLRDYAHQRDVRIIGDIPIFVAYDSSDVWANPDLFYLGEDGRPTVVAGVPPDYFSATGQLWGNPLYRWDRLAETGYHWWLRRFQSLLRQVDIVRVDHFRGFAAYWEVPAGEPTAVNGRWVRGPGVRFFEAVQSALGDVPVIAEDLGLITPDVVALRDTFGLPGMAVLQFAFGDDAINPYLPHNLAHNTVIYTGTHDNDTTLGWYLAAPPAVRDSVTAYLGCAPADIAWDFIRLALASVADTAIIPLQDVLGLDTSGRMNLPGHLGGNWAWRYATGDLSGEHARRLAALTHLYGRDADADRRRAARANEPAVY